jgi:CRISPR-associated protein Cas5d
MISEPLRIRVRGPRACFTRPEFHVERVSYPVITPSAARGILEAILMKPIEKPNAERRKDKTGFRWRVLRLGIINKGFLMPILRNELGYKSHSYRGYDVSDTDYVRAQRHSLILTGGVGASGESLMLDYLIEGVIEVPNGQAYDNGCFLIAKYQEMFTRYAQQGRCFHRPYFGCREFSCDFEWAPDVSPAPSIQEPFGPMLRDFDFSPVWEHWPENQPRPTEWTSPDGRTVSPKPIGFTAVADKGWITVAKVAGQNGKKEVIELD